MSIKQVNKKKKKNSSDKHLLILWQGGYKIRGLKNISHKVSTEMIKNISPKIVGKKIIL